MRSSSTRGDYLVCYDNLYRIQFSDLINSFVLSPQLTVASDSGFCTMLTNTIYGSQLYVEVLKILIDIACPDKRLVGGRLGPTREQKLKTWFFRYNFL